MVDPHQYYTPDEAADFIRVSPRTLQVWRSQGRGPSYRVLGNRIRYPRSALVEYLEANQGKRARLEAEAECHVTRRSRTKRLRGRKGAEQRRNRLAAEPFCRDCRDRGHEVPSEEVDHIVRLEDGGTDTDDNVRCLCKNCHRLRTAFPKEAYERGLAKAAERASA